MFSSLLEIQCFLLVVGSCYFIIVLAFPQPFTFILVLWKYVKSLLCVGLMWYFFFYGSMSCTWKQPKIVARVCRQKCHVLKTVPGTVHIIGHWWIASWEVIRQMVIYVYAWFTVVNVFAFDVFTPIYWMLLAQNKNNVRQNL